MTQPMQISEMTSTAAGEDAIAARRRRMALLARSREADIERLWPALGALPAHRFLRRAETGLAMVRARAGGEGAKFNLGEMTLIRCAVRLPGGETGIGYVQGRSARHAELAALADALAQSPDHAERVERALLAPLAGLLDRREREARRRARSSRVEFFALERGARPGARAAAGDAAVDA